MPRAYSSPPAAASKADMEAATDGVKLVPVNMVANHPGVAKAIVMVDQTSTQSINFSHNVASITDEGVGITLVTLTTALAAAGVAFNSTPGDSTANGVVIGAPNVSDCAAESFRLRARAANTGGYYDKLIGGVYYGF